MGKLVDYLRENGQFDFDKVPLSVVDIAILNELAYLPIGELIAEFDTERKHQESYSLSELIPLYQVAREQVVLTFMVTQERLELLDAVLVSPRYQDLQLSHYINDISTEFEKQFAAVVLSFPSIGHTQVIFRGTDSSLIGWKEDLNMTYMSEIPAQRAARQYLKQFMQGHEGMVLVSGHSKGGNLALYATSGLLTSHQERISEVYLFDSPGLHKSALKTQGYDQIRSKLRVYRPYEAVVGVMLTSDVEPIIVSSSERGFAQHVMTNWEIEGQDFLQLPQASPFSQALEKTFDEWMVSYSKQELKVMVDSFFSIFLDAGLDSLDDMLGLNQVSLNLLITQFARVDSIKRNLMLKSLSKMVDLFIKHDRALKKEQAARDFQARYQQSFLSRILDGTLKGKMVSSDDSTTEDSGRF